MHGAALPGAAEDLSDGPRQAFVGVGDAEQDAGEATSRHAAQELAPKGLRLGLVDVDADHLMAAALDTA